MNDRDALDTTQARTRRIARFTVKTLFSLFGIGVAFTVGMNLLSMASTFAALLGVVVLALSVGVAIIVIGALVDQARSLVTLALVMLCLLGSVGCGYQRVEPGHVGIKVHLYGGDKGVDFEALPVGAVWYNPWTATVYQYPTFVQTAIWTAAKDEGSPTNEEMTFNTKEGMVVSGDISLSYHLEADKVPAFFAKFRTDQLATFTHGFLRNVARDAFNDLGPTYTVEQVYGEKKEELRRAVIARIQGEVATYGVALEQFGYIGALRLPDKVVASLNAKIGATQDALRVQNEVAQSQAEALKWVAQAEGQAKAKLALANAEAQANKTVAASITPELVSYESVKRWNGVLPTVSGNATPFVSLPNLAAAK